MQASSQVRENNAVSEKVDSSTAATPSDSAQDSRICDEKSLLCELTQGRILGVCNRRAHEAIKDLSRKSAQNKRSGASAAQQVSLEKPNPPKVQKLNKLLAAGFCDDFVGCRAQSKGAYLGYVTAALRDDSRKSAQKPTPSSDSSPKAESPKPKLDSIYIGGGTPSLLPSSAYTLIFAQIARFCDMQSVQEITIEANPNSLQAQWCRDLASLGVNRISFGVQSFDPRKLVFLEREHSGRDIYHALEAAQVFPHRSIDMMYGTPFDDEATLRADMQKACALDIDHLSAYSLMIEDGARFAHKHKSLAAPSPEQKDSLEGKHTSCVK